MNCVKLGKAGHHSLLPVISFKALMELRISSAALNNLWCIQACSSFGFCLIA